MQKAKKAKKDKIYGIKPAQRVASQPEQKVAPLLGRMNYIIFGIGLIVLVAGYFFLAQPNDPGKPAAEGFLSLNVAPILLVVAYLIIIPIALLLRKSKKTEEQNS